MKKKTSPQIKKAIYSYSPFEKVILRDGEVIATVGETEVTYLNKKYRLPASKVVKALNLLGQREETRASVALESEQKTESANSSEYERLMAQWNTVSHGLQKNSNHGTSHTEVNE